MSFKDSEMHTVAAIGACALTAALCVPTVIAGSGGGDDKQAAPPLEERTSIAAAIAKQSKPKKLPEKPTSPPPPEVKPDGINRDLDHIPDPKDRKPDQAKRTPDPKDPKPNFDDFRREDPDNPAGKPVTEPGPFNENEKGFADITTGHPYFRALAGLVNEKWSFPGILESKSGAEGCLHILADGKIAKVKVDPRSGDATFDDAVEGTMKKVEALRNAKPEPVPPDLVREATTRWICFKFKAEKRAD